MEVKDYLNFARKTAIYPKIFVLKNPNEDQIRKAQEIGLELENITWIYPLIGLFGEAGELANILKKVIRDNHFKINDELLSKVLDEKGDLSWYSIILDHELNLDPDKVLENNINKLQKRQSKNQLHDTGGSR